MRGLTSAELRLWQPPIQPYIIDGGILVPETKMVLFGKYATWKSMVTIHTAYTVANGKSWFGYKTNAASTYIVQSEIPQFQNKERVTKYITGNELDSPYVWHAWEPYTKLDKGFGLAELEKELERTKAKLLIIDPLYKFISGRLSDEYDIRQLLDRLDMLIPKYHITIIVVHHPRKSILVEGVEIDMGGDDIYGAYLQNWADTILKITSKMDAEITLHFSKTRHAQVETPKDFNVKIDRDRLVFSRMAPK